MTLQSRKAAFITSPNSQLIEMDGQLGYEVEGKFIPVYHLRPDNRRSRKSARDMLKKLLDESPHLREQAKAGLVTFSIQGNNIYLHTTVEGFKAQAAESMHAVNARRKAGITPEVYMKVNFTPEQYAGSQKQVWKQLEGADLEGWATARFNENEREITKLKQDHSRGRVSKAFSRLMPARPFDGLVLH